MYDKCFGYSLLLKKKLGAQIFFSKISLYIHRYQTGFSKRIMPLKKKNIYGITFYTEILKRKVNLGDFIFFISEKTYKSTLQLKICV
jgi:hypothetical protein